jgi:light-regulated signal transduction histidine kinase (bacteriophytochrome)
MTEMIDGLLELSRVGRAPVQPSDVDLAEVAQAVLGDLAEADPQRKVDTKVPSSLPVFADRRLIRNVLENLLGNAWKFTGQTSSATIDVGAETQIGDSGEETPVYFIRDNGDGFDMAHAQKLFSPFQRLHHQSDFPGTGIGLATVNRIIDRHGGRVWADAQPGQGATFRFTLRPRPPL